MAYPASVASQYLVARTDVTSVNLSQNGRQKGRNGGRTCVGRAIATLIPVPTDRDLRRLLLQHTACASFARRIRNDREAAGHIREVPRNPRAAASFGVAVKVVGVREREGHSRGWRRIAALLAGGRQRSDRQQCVDWQHERKLSPRSHSDVSLPLVLDNRCRVCAHLGQPNS
jgi:hypothetical protein